MLLSNKHVLMDTTNGEALPAGGATEPAVPAPSVPAGSDVDWEGESAPDHDTVDGLTVSTAPARPKVETPPVKPVSAVPSPAPATPPVSPAPSAPAAATPAVIPATPVAPAPAATPEPQPMTPQAPAAPAPDRAALRTAYVQELTSKYALTDEQTRGILVEPEKHLPSLMANMHVEIADAVINTVMQSIPGVVTNLTKQSQAVQEAEREFFATWPTLSDVKYANTVASAIRAYRAVNPQASRQEVIRAAGLHALISLRLPIPQELFAQPTPPAPQPSGFTHAAPGAGGPPPAAPQPNNPFQLLNSEFDREERG